MVRRITLVVIIAGLGLALFTFLEFVMLTSSPHGCDPAPFVYKSGFNATEIRKEKWYTAMPKLSDSDLKEMPLLFETIQKLSDETESAESINTVEDYHRYLDWLDAKYPPDGDPSISHNSFEYGDKLYSINMRVC